ncbi:1-acyl-sn-glycerol-3-phosphate acyltransferase [Anopheles darlingi]|uniref:1-acylglycerol-3-phosphate O-acyltransferase n=1 Tax=Anopheles darlingi TaxID=43151 RepID=W5JC98_ANODA|nr:1-acyl-sn-glycerol-3-phosphate acyltransferase [Anopheles darlingi]
MTRGFILALSLSLARARAHCVHMKDGFVMTHRNSCPFFSFHPSRLLAQMVIITIEGSALSLSVCFLPLQNVFLNSLTLQVLVALLVGSLLSTTFKYHAKLFIILLMSFLVLVVPIPLFLFKPRWPLNALVPGIVACLFIRAFGVEYEIRGQEHINVRNGGVVLLNHQSAIDIVMLSRLLREFRNIVPVVKKELFYVLPFGIASYLVGVVFIDRQNSASAKDVMKREAVAITKDHVSDMNE